MGSVNMRPSSRHHTTGWPKAASHDQPFSGAPSAARFSSPSAATATSAADRRLKISHGTSQTSPAAPVMMKAERQP